MSDLESGSFDNEFMVVDEASEDETGEKEDKFTLDTEIAEHPYLDLIESFELEKEQLQITSPASAKSLIETPLHIVDTRAALIKLLQALRNVTEIGIDLIIDEKTFHKCVYIMCLSTQEADYIIDAAVLNTELLLLGEIFTNPKKVKILSKSHISLCFLQQKLCLYVVNMFDVDKAGEALFGEAPTVNQILKNNYKVKRKMNKLPGDLITRPFTDNAKQFCRIKSHYLVHIYHDYKNQLIEKDLQLYKTLLEQCREASKDLRSDEQLEVLADLKEQMLRHQQAELQFLKKMVAWRGNIAKKLDKSPRDILDNFCLLRLSSHVPARIEYIKKLSKSEHVRNDAYQIVKVANDIRRQFKLDFCSRQDLKKQYRQANPSNVTGNAISTTQTQNNKNVDGGCPSWWD